MSRPHHHLFAGAAMVAAMSVASVAIAAPKAFDIPAGPLATALEAYARQSRQQLLYSPALVAGRSVPAIRGVLDQDDVLNRLLAGSGITVKRVRPGVLVLQPAASAVGPSSALDGAGLTVEDVGEPAEVAELVVTGTYIRGQSIPASPLVMFNRDDIDRSGAGTLADALSALPQNFGGAGTPDTYLTSADGLATNTGLATGVNLRGLGPDSTLVLINGRRMAGTGAKGDFADVSAIPLAAIERVDVLLDGASALYGSDAVGGVVNVILRGDFEGAETRIRGGVAEGGVAEEFQVGQTFGWKSDRVALMVSGEYYERQALNSADRRFTKSADLRPLGGTDHRTYISVPGNILRFEPAAGAYVPGWAIPTGQDGTALSPSDLIAGGVNLGNIREGMDVIPEQTRFSGYGQLSWSITPTVEARVDARYSRREFAFHNTAPVTVAFMSAANPYFVSPDGAPAHILTYSFLNELGSTRTSGTSQSVGLSAGLDFDLPRAWQAEIYAAYAQERIDGANDNFLNSGFVNEALGVVPDNPATPFSTAADGFLNLYGNGESNSREILDFISSGYTRYQTQNEITSLNVIADGRLFDLPGGEAKLAIGGQIRREVFAQRGRNFTTSAVATTNIRPTFERMVSAVFAEIRLPIVGGANAAPGIQRLEVSLAARMEDYDDIGSTADPKVGVVWSPVAGLTLRGTYGTSFRAPALVEIYEAPDISPGSLPRGSANILSIIRYGGNRDLNPETATTWTVGADWRPTALPDLKLGATWFDVDFSDQIGRPVVQSIDTALTNPAFASFVRLVDPAIPADRLLLEALMADPDYNDPSGYPITSFGAIVDARHVNTATLKVRGLDVSVGYRWTVGADTISFDSSATYLADYERQLTPTSGFDQLVDTVGQPVDLRGRATVNWRRGASQTTATINYVDDYRDPVTGRSIDSWTTVDLSWRWEPARLWNTEGVTLAVSVQNLFDTEPPFYDNIRGIGFDAANADPLGRVVAVQAIKRW